MRTIAPVLRVRIVRTRRHLEPVTGKELEHAR